MPMRTKQVKRSRPVSKWNSETQRHETTYEVYWADESYWEPEPTSDSYGGSSNDG